MPRLYAVQRCDRMKGWEDVSYFQREAEAVRASEQEAQASPGLVTRVIRKPHGFEPPEVRAMQLNFQVAKASPPTMIYEIGRERPVEYLPGRATFEMTCELVDPEVEAERRARKHRKKLSREASARARIPSWHVRLLREEG